MKIEVERDECIGCESCVPVCPVEAISMVGLAQIDQELCIQCRACVGLAQIDQELCIQCRACVDICPVEAIKVKEE